MWFRIEILYFPLSVLIGFNLISDGYPLKMKLSISGEAQKYQASIGGTYLLQENKTNDKPFWIHQSGGKAIWWDNDNDNWNVGNFEYLGSSKAGIIGPSNNDSPPNQIKQGWKYANNRFHDTNGVHFEDWTFKQGKFLHLLCKNLFHRVHADVSFL